jgi:aspartyl-tRNA(Asn)/glutamyl-tRNA(Gln) amidotransferase subunit C
MKLELSEVRHVAKLARLALTDAEEVQFSTQLSAVLDAIGLLSTVDTAGVPPTTFAVHTEAMTRADHVRDELGVEAALRNAPQKHDGAFAIPRVIE